MTELQPYQPMTTVATTTSLLSDTDSWVSVVADVATLAGQIADTEFVPDTMRRRPAAVAACILSGRELGVAPMTSLAHIHIVKGKPGMSAQLMRALILSAGHELDFKEATTTRCIVAGRRRGSDSWTVAQFTADDAKRARIDLGGYPEDKLVARATARLARRIFADVLGGMPYLVDELEDPSVPDVAPVTPISDGPKRRTARRASAKPATTVQRVDAPAAAETVYDEPPFDDSSDDDAGEAVESLAAPSEASPSEGITAAQMKKVAAQMRDLGITDRDDALGYVAEVIGRNLTSRNELTKDEAHALIEHMGRALGEISEEES